MHPKEGIGHRLRLAREALGYAQKRMAEAAGSKFRSWQDYEADRKTPGSQVIAGLVRLGINANWVLIGEGPMMLADLQVAVAHEAHAAPHHILDQQLLSNMMTKLDELIEEAGEVWTPREKADVVAQAYKEEIEEGPLEDKRRDIIKLLKTA